MKRSEITRGPLPDTTLSHLEPEDGEYRERDSGHLYFRVKPNGLKDWQFRYKKRSTGQWTWLGLGGYPAISGRLARTKAKQYEELVNNGIDPKEYEEQQRQSKLEVHLFTFQQLAIEYCATKSWTEETRARNEGALNNHVYPVMGNRDYRHISKKEWLELIKQIQQKLNPRTGMPIIEMGNRVRGLCKDIYDLAEVTGRIEYNPLVGLDRFIHKHRSQNMPHVTQEELPTLLRDIRNFYDRSKVTSIGLQLSILLGCRPSEMRKAVWSEFDFDKKIWIIPAHRMKKRIEHTIPLSNQVIQLLNELKLYSGQSNYLFKGRSRSDTPISENTFGKALKTMGYQGKQTPHGFRHILSTALRERGFQKEWVESALAHKVGGVEGVYNKAVYLQQRKTMMQNWADYLDSLVNGDAVQAIDSTEDAAMNQLFNILNLNDEQKALLQDLIQVENEIWQFGPNENSVEIGISTNS